MYARIDLSKTNYSKLSSHVLLTIQDFEISELQSLYKEYCNYKKFKSVMPIFDSEFTDPKNDVIGYYNNQQLVAFSLLRRFDNENVEAVQFAWNYNNPKLSLGINSLKSECAVYKELGFRYLYLGGADEYKKKIDGFELLGPL
jgi:arginyl-tRNA--protein-N-Asp/Glu arginylyltransferase